MREWTREKRLRTRSEAGTLALGELMTELLRRRSWWCCVASSAWARRRW